MSESTAYRKVSSNIALQQVGKPLVRTDAPDKAYGTTEYAGDQTMHNMLHGRVFRADRASAILKKLDVSKARALPGVHCVMTAEDLPDRLVVTDIPGQTGGMTKNTAQPMLVKDRVKVYGEAIALVAAETPDIAEQALGLIEVEYGEYEGVYDPFEALKPGAPIVYGEDNEVARYKIRKGDLEKGFEAADYVLEDTYKTHIQEQAFIEPEAGMAWYDDQDILNIHVATQVVEHFRTIADAIGVPHNKVRIKAKYVGGGFGGKEGLTIETYLALLVQKTRRPVRIVLTREDSFVSHGPRHPFTFKHRTGFTKDGKITAMEVDAVADAGAYAKLSPYVLLYGTIGCSGPYRVDNLKIDSVAVATNNLAACAYRGFGTMQACVALEGQIDQIAKKLGVDSMVIRRKNLLKPGEANATGQVIESAIWAEQCADKAMEALGERTPDSEGVKIGRAVACYQQSYGRIRWFHDTSESWVGIEVDGSVIVRCAVTDIGQGASSAIAQVAAEVLGVPMERVTTYFGDATLNPLAGTSSASRACYMTGKATSIAAKQVRLNLLEYGAKVFEVDPDQLELRDSKIFVIDEPNRSMSLKDFVAKCAAAGVHRHNLGMYRAPFSDGLDPETGQGEVFPDFTYGAHAVELAVDTDTGEITMLKSVGAHDVGQAINLRAVEGQIEGSALMGQGFALCEEIVLNEGKVMTPSLSEYLIPTSEDVPEIKSIVLESRSGLGAFGSKGIGEPAFAPVAAAIANAVHDAIGTRINNLPITPDKVVKALAEQN